MPTTALLTAIRVLPKYVQRYYRIRLQGIQLLCTVLWSDQRQPLCGFTSLHNNVNTVFDEGVFWSKDRFDADAPMPRINSTPSYYEGTRFHYDGSFIRLKNAEVAYTFTQPWVKKIGLNRFKIFLNGNNLWVWSRMPDDRESNFAGTGLASQGAYPTVRRFNLGIKFDL